MISELGEGLCFLLTVPRSGSTLLAHMLGRHPKICAPPEPWLMLALSCYGRVSPRHPADSRLVGQAYREFSAGLDTYRATAAAATSLYNQYRETTKPEATVVIDKTPRYYMLVEDLSRYFPQARFIVLLRNPLAVAFSYKTTWDRDLPRLIESRTDVPEVFDFVLGYRALARLAASDSARIRTVQYEPLVANPERHMTDLTRFLGLAPTDWPADVLSPDPTYQNSSFGDKKVFETRSVHTNSVDGWRHSLSQADKKALVNALGPSIIAALGYSSILEPDVLCADSEAQAKSCYDDVAEMYRQRTSDVERTSHYQAVDCDLMAALGLAYSDPEAALRAATTVKSLQQEVFRLKLTHESAERDLGDARRDLAGLQVVADELRALKLRYQSVEDDLREARKELVELHGSRWHRLGHRLGFNPPERKKPILLDGEG